MPKRFLITDGKLGALPCMIAGDGPPLVLLPGLSPDNHVPTGFSRRLEEQLIQAFATRFTVYWTARPSGLSPGTTLRHIADQVARGIHDTLHAPSDVLGISTGGSIAQQLAADHPAEVRRLVLVSTGCRLAGPTLTMQRQMIALAAGRDPRRTLAGMARQLVPRWRGQNLAAAVMYLFGLRLYPHARDTRDLEITLRAEEPFELSSLPVISASTLIISGGRDRFYGRAVIEETAACIPRSRLAIYPGRGHLTVLSDPKALREIHQFLSR